MAPTPPLTFVCAFDVTAAAPTEVMDAVVATIEDAEDVECHNGREYFCKSATPYMMLTY